RTRSPPPARCRCRRPLSPRSGLAACPRADNRVLRHPGGGTCGPAAPAETAGGACHRRLPGEFDSLTYTDLRMRLAPRGRAAPWPAQDACRGLWFSPVGKTAALEVG